ncbi:kinetochore complex Sim4 subunit Fta1-domain-containing protein [Echria macrotheca]|uniref:Kinetochore complex Sim4 subunit Fta1-domain-containing protein n=1 Tax=Echria macrotheca TaxID=438768 RepID=A0AAJ0BI70_9PEZI|nr:kinetochore complex Sim4 subunit Fta1-domain-containing protein [Echria macrotheca]
MSSRRRPQQSPRRQSSVSALSQRTRSSLALSQTSSDDVPAAPFYNTTFSAHRLSPLHLGPDDLNPRRLQTVAQRLRDTLVGDVVRGVEVGLGRDDGDDPVMGRAGALEAVELRWVRMATLLDLGSSEGDKEEDDGQLLRNKNALSLSLRYEAASCTALLLPPLDDDTDQQQQPAAQTDSDFWGHKTDAKVPDKSRFLHLPLLLLRMPAPLKSIIAEFLSVTFDCRVSPLRLGTRSILRAWESWIKSAGLPTRGPLAKDVVLTLGFYIPPSSSSAPIAQGGDGDEEDPESQKPGLKSVDIFIPAPELRRFVDAAAATSSSSSSSFKPAAAQSRQDEDDHDEKKRTTQLLAGLLNEEGWSWNNRANHHPFTHALALYLDAHLGMNLFHPGVRITKIACGGFVIADGKVKVFAPADLRQQQVSSAEEESVLGSESLVGQRRAVFELLRDLVRKAAGRDHLA